MTRSQARASCSGARPRLAVIPRRGQAGRPPRLQPPLDVGPPVRDLRRPLPAHLRGLVAACRRRRCATERTRARAARRREHVPQPGPRREGRVTTIDHVERRPGDPRHRRRLDGASSTRPTGSSSGSGFGQRLDWLDESVAAMRALLDGEIGDVRARAATTRSTTCATQPVPVQPHLPIMIGGCGEKKTLRTVAKYADMWNAMGPLDVDEPQGARCCGGTARTSGGTRPRSSSRSASRRRSATRRPRPIGSGRPRWSTTGRRCPDVEDDDTFWNGTPEQLAEKLAPYVELGFHTVITEQPAPYDTETFERLIGEVKPLVDRG